MIYSAFLQAIGVNGLQDEQQNEVEVAEEVETSPAEVSASPAEVSASAKETEEIEDSRPQFIQSMEAFVDTKLFQALMLITTIYALIGTDIAAWVGISQEQYKIMHTVSLIALILFFVEWFLQWMCKDGYFNGGKGFFFWLDFIAALSLIPDVPMISEPLAAAMGMGGGAGGGLAIARAGRAARAGARAGRIARIFKLLKKALPAIQKMMGKELPEDEENDDLGELAPSAIGGVFGDLMTRKAIVGVMLMLIFVAMLDYQPPRPFDTAGLGQLEQTSGEMQELLVEQYKRKFNFQGELVRDEHAALAPLEAEHKEFRMLGIDTKEDKAADIKRKMRIDEINAIIALAPPRLVYLNLNGETVESAWDKTLIKSPISEAGGARFDKRKELVLKKSDVLRIFTPNAKSQAWFDIRHEKAMEGKNAFFMTLFVVVLLGTGSMLFQSDAEKLFIGPIMKMTDIVRELADNPLAALDAGGDEDDSETAVVTKAMVKIGGMLQIGFGEAGAEIIAHNMASGGDLDVMIPGEKIDAIYGFCDIRSFTDATECLQEDVMLFVNEIGGIVHHATVESGGAPNKNIGDAFLLIWKPKPGETMISLCDGALNSFIEVIEEINASRRLREITQHEGLQARIPGFTTKMGFGLHLGWSIEGAIGSNYKVGCSYLSPNVNMAARLEAATKQFGAEILLSGDFYHGLTPSMKAKCRQIDHITVKGSIQPMKLYSCDVTFPPGVNSTSYYQTFGQAVEHYTAGNWPEAKEILESCLETWTGDVPPQNILTVMEDSDFTAPDDWEGYRALTEK